MDFSIAFPLTLALFSFALAMAGMLYVFTRVMRMKPNKVAGPLDGTYHLRQAGTDRDGTPLYEIEPRDAK